MKVGGRVVVVRADAFVVAILVKEPVCAQFERFDALYPGGCHQPGYVMGRFTGVPADSSHLDQSVPYLAEVSGDEVEHDFSLTSTTFEVIRYGQAHKCSCRFCHLDQSVPYLEDPGDEGGVGISWPLLSVEMQRAPR